MWSGKARLRPVLQWLTNRTVSSKSQASSRGSSNSFRRRKLPSRRSQSLPKRPKTGNPSGQSTPAAESLSSALRDTNPEQNSLLSPVHIPDDPNAVLKERHPAAKLLANSGLVVQRQLELMNVMLGFEQANRYVIMNGNGNHVGYMAERETGIGNMLARQWFRTHRSFVTHVFDKDENEVLRFHRPFSWINSRIRVYDPLGLADPASSPSAALRGASPPSRVAASDESSAKISPLGFDDMRVIGEAQQQWAPLRRKYHLFLFHPPQMGTETASKPISPSSINLSGAQQAQPIHTSHDPRARGEYHQFAFVDEPFLSWNFCLRAADDRLIGSVNRNFAGFTREIFTDTGVYALRMDSAAFDEASEQRDIPAHTGESSVTYPNDSPGMTLDQRAIMLATAVSIDYDYFSRHSSAGGMGFMPLWIPGAGEEAVASGSATGETEAAGVVAPIAKSSPTGESVTAEETGGAGASGPPADSAAAGAGTIMGYEAMRKGMQGNAEPPVPLPQAQSDVKNDIWDSGEDEASSHEDEDEGDSDWF